jgi:hypothetical protein
VSNYKALNFITDWNIGGGTTGSGNGESDGLESNRQALISGFLLFLSLMLFAVSVCYLEGRMKHNLSKTTF